MHMTWGAVNEWTTQAGYSRLAAKADHPVLSELLARIMKQEGRHIDFYASEAHRRLERSRTARKLTRFALRKAWSPVGAGVMPDSEVAFMTRFLFDNDEGRAMVARIDRRIDRLPALEGLRLLEGALEKYRSVRSPSPRGSSDSPSPPDRSVALPLRREGMAWLRRSSWSPRSRARRASSSWPVARPQCPAGRPS